MNTSPQAKCASDSSQPGAQTQGACVLIPELPSTGGRLERVCTGGTVGGGQLPLGVRLETPCLSLQPALNPKQKARNPLGEGPDCSCSQSSSKTPRLWGVRQNAFMPLQEEEKVLPAPGHGQIYPASRGR